jgi:hypothetical protein
VIDLFNECGLDSATGAAIAAAHLGAPRQHWLGQFAIHRLGTARLSGQTNPVVLREPIFTEPLHGLCRKNGAGGFEGSAVKPAPSSEYIPLGGVARSEPFDFPDTGVLKLIVIIIVFLALSATVLRQQPRLVLRPTGPLPAANVP